MHNSHAMRIFATIVGVIVGVVVIFAGFKLFQSTFARAGDEAPRDVIVTDISQNNAKVTWSTGVENQAVIEYGTSPTALNFFAPETTKSKTHSVELSLLSPTTTYYFQIRIGDQKYDNGGVPWTFTTRGTDKSQASDPETTPPLTQPSPVATLVVDEAPTCAETDCAKIKEKLGQGCTTKDYVLCLQKPTTAP